MRDMVTKERNQIAEDSKGYLLEEYGFSSLNELDIFYANLLETAKKEPDAEIMKPSVIAAWHRMRQEFEERKRAIESELEMVADHLDRCLTN